MRKAAPFKEGGDMKYARVSIVLNVAILIVGLAGATLQGQPCEEILFEGYCAEATEPSMKEWFAWDYCNAILEIAPSYGYFFETAGEFFDYVVDIQEEYGNIASAPIEFQNLLTAVNEAMIEQYGDCMAPGYGSLSPYYANALGLSQSVSGPWLTMTQTGTASTYYERLIACGFNVTSVAGVQTRRFTAVIEIRQPFGFGGTIPGPGSFEHVNFFVDWNDDGVFQPWESEGIGTAHLNDNSGLGNPLWYFSIVHSPTAGLSTAPLNGRTLQVRAILSWMMLPLKGSIGTSGVIWGNELTFQIRLDP